MYEVKALEHSDLVGLIRQKHTSSLEDQATLAHEANCVTPHRMRRKPRETSFRLWAHSCTARYC
jgi:hypothetical protein